MENAEHYCPMSEQAVPLIHIVSDDSTLCGSLQRLLKSVGLQVTIFTHAEALLAAYQPDKAGCLVLGVRSGLDSLHIQHSLLEQGVELPIIIIAGHSEVPAAVAAMKQGATDFIEKPFNEQMLLDCVHNALSQDTVRRRIRRQRQEVLWRYQALSLREQEVLKQVAQGLSNREIAEVLNLSRKTVEVHRAKVMQKMQAENLSQLIRMAMTLGILKNYDLEG